MNSKKTINTNPPPKPHSSNLAETQENQAVVTQRMIGKHRGRTKRARLFKFISVLTLSLALAAVTWWVLSEFKKPDQSWDEAIQSLAQRIFG